LNDLTRAFAEAVRMIWTLDPDITSAVSASLRFSLSSTALASLIGIPTGIALATSRMRLRKIIIGILNTLLAMPTVAVGLFVYALICSQGPLGRLRLLFTPAAIIVGQTVLIAPLVAALVCGAVSVLNPVVRETAMTLGAGRMRMFWTLASEMRAAVLVACITAFGRVVGEVGISLLLGGNIGDYTRTITTAIALQTSKGEFALGLGLGLILLCVAFVINMAVRTLGTRNA
jgi:tungstate transport system permease protein